MATLPNGYIKLKWIYNEGLGSINTLFYADHNTRVVVNARASYADGRSGKNNYVFTSNKKSIYVNNNNIRCYYNLSYTTKTYTKFEGGSTVNNYIFSDEKVHNFDFKKRSFVLDYDYDKTIYFDYQEWSDSTPICIATGSPLYIHSAQIYDDDELVRDLIPAKEISTEKVGLYDIVNDIFYTSDNDSFVAGDEVVEIIKSDANLKITSCKVVNKKYIITFDTDSDGDIALYTNGSYNSWAGDLSGNTITVDVLSLSNNKIQLKQKETDNYYSDETNVLTLPYAIINEPEITYDNNTFKIKTLFVIYDESEINAYVNGEYVTQKWETQTHLIVDDNNNDIFFDYRYFTYETPNEGTYIIKGIINNSKNEIGLETSGVTATATISRSDWSPSINYIPYSDSLTSHSFNFHIQIGSISDLDLDKLKVKVYNGSTDVTKYSISYVASSCLYVQMYIPDSGSIYYTIDYEGDGKYNSYHYRSETYTVADSGYEQPTWVINPANKETGTNLYAENSLVSFAATMSDTSKKIQYTLRKDGSLSNLLSTTVGESGEEITYTFGDKGKYVLYAEIFDVYSSYPDNAIAYYFNVIDPADYVFNWNIQKTTLDTGYIKTNYSATVSNHSIDKYKVVVDNNEISGITDNSYTAKDHCQISLTAYTLDGVSNTYPTFDPFSGLTLSTLYFGQGNNNINVGKEGATDLTSIITDESLIFKVNVGLSDLETDVDWIHLTEVKQELITYRIIPSTGKVWRVWCNVLVYTVDAYDGDVQRVGHIYEKGKHATTEHRLNITQFPKSVVIINPDSFVVNYEEQTVTSNVIENNALDMAVQSNNDWIEATLSGDTITYKIAKNNSFSDNRSGSVTFSYKEGTGETHTINIPIQQTYNDTCSLVFDGNPYNVEYNSGSLNVVATCHHVKSISNVSTPDSWITLSSPTDLPLAVDDNDEKTFVFNYNDNEYGSRTSNVIFTFTDESDSAHTATIKVIQADVPGSTIKIVPDTHTVTANKSHVVTSNVYATNTTDLTCSSNCNWAVPTLGSGQISVAVAQDASNVTREATIQVSGKNVLGKPVNASLKVVQRVKVNTTIRLSTEGELKIGETIKIKVESNNKTSSFNVKVDGTSIGNCKSGEYVEYKLTKAGDTLINVSCVESDTHNAASENLTISVDKTESTLSLSITGTKKINNTLNIIATSNNKTGLISIYANDVKLGTRTSGNGIGWKPTAAGTYTIKAEITDTSNYNGATVTKTVNIADREIILFTVTGDFKQYKPLTITLDTLTDGIVYFSDGTNLIGACSDKNTVVYTPTSAGTTTIYAKCYETEYWDADTEEHTYNIEETVLPPSSGDTPTPTPVYSGTSEGAVYANGTIVTNVSGSTIVEGYGVLPNVYFTEEFDTNLGNYGIDVEFEVTGNNCKIIDGDSFGVSCQNGVFTIRCKSQTIETTLESGTTATVNLYVYANNGYTKVIVNGTEYKKDAVISYSDNDSINIYGSTLKNTIHYVNVVNTRCRPVLYRHMYEFCTVDGDFAIYDQFEGKYMKSSQSGCTLKSK